jgi:hypothetical protein
MCQTRCCLTYFPILDIKWYDFIYNFLNYEITFSFKTWSYLVSWCYNFWFFGTETIVIEGLTCRKDCTLCWDVYIICTCNVVILSDYCLTIRNKLLATFVSLGSEVDECSILFEIIGRVPVIQSSCNLMNPVNSGSVPANTGRVHATIVRVHATIGRVPVMIGWVSGKIGRVPIIVGRRRGEIAAEYHTCLMPYRVEPVTSDMFHRWIEHVRWTETWKFIIEV